MKNLTKAIDEWSALLTKKRVITESLVLHSEGTATFRTSQKIWTVLKPVSSAEVSSIVKIATRYSIPVSPVSGGKNWGLGSKVPQRSGVIIDLSLMKKITRYDPSLAYMTVEPGVTFKAAEQFLNNKKSPLMLDTLGSTPEASIIGNTAERGHGMALYADRFNFVCGMEIVLPNGDIIETGFENIEGSKLGPLAKWGLGPYVDGLFTQSNLGIITKLTLWLRAKPAFFQSFIFNVDAVQNLSSVMDQCRQMGLEGFTISLRIFNDMRMISFGQRFPEDEKKPLSEVEKAKMRSQLRIGKWIGLGGLYSISPQHAVADKEYLRNRLGTLIDNITFYDQVSVDKEYEKADDARKAQLDFLFNKSLLRGYTSVAGINMTYWRKPSTITVSDLHKDQCGVLWYCPAIPFTGKDAAKAIRICARICKKYGFELNFGFLFISQRTLDITGAICYDRAIKGEDEKAIRCHDELMKEMVDSGYSPYRLGIQSMKLMKNKSAASLKFLKKLKASLDPQNILSPGHYI